MALKGLEAFCAVNNQSCGCGQVCWAHHASSGEGLLLSADGLCASYSNVLPISHSASCVLAWGSVMMLLGSYQLSKQSWQVFWCMASTPMHQSARLPWCTRQYCRCVYLTNPDLHIHTISVSTQRQSTPASTVSNMQSARREQQLHELISTSNITDTLCLTTLTPAPDKHEARKRERQFWCDLTPQANPKQELSLPRYKNLERTVHLWHA